MAESTAQLPCPLSIIAWRYRPLEARFRMKFGIFVSHSRPNQDPSQQSQVFGVQSCRLETMTGWR